jgi:Ankyrin repeats (3 copies)
MRTWAYERKFVMPIKPLPQNPSLAHLRYQAKDLIQEHAARDPRAAQRIREFHPKFQRAQDPEIFDARFSLSDAQLTIARERGFPSWQRLKRHIEKPALADRLDLPHHNRIEDVRFQRAVELVDAGDAGSLRAHLKQYPKLVHEHVLFEGGNYFRNPTLLEFIAENPIRHGRLPDNIVEVATVIIEAGADQTALNKTLGLVATGMVPRQCRVQVSLTELLCARGADPNGALHGAAVHGELEAVEALLRCGGKVDLPIAAALGRTDDARRLLLSADSEDRHLALTLSAMFGRVEIVRMLLDQGDDPDRYNPIGAHSHSTPLHQAALAGHDDVVRLLVEREARLDIRDILWQGTPADWARHGGKTEVEHYLRQKEKNRSA